MATTAHIRDRQPRVRGNGFYKVQGHDAPNLCGAPYTQDDVGFGDVRSLRGATSWLNGRADLTGTSSGLRDVTVCPDCHAAYRAKAHA